MFRNTNFLSLDLNSFDTSNIDSFLCFFFVSKATYIDILSFDTSKVTNMADMFRNVSIIVGYAKDEGAADKFNDSSVTGIPSTLKFVVK